jgi:hypothetical protein
VSFQPNTVAGSPEVFDPSIIEPQDHGYQAWTYDPAISPASQAVVTAGAVYLMRMKVPQSIIATGITVYVSTLGVTVANAFMGLYSNGGTLIGTTANQSTPFQSTGLKNAALSGGPFTIPGGVGGWLWGAVIVGSAGTMCQFQRSLSQSAADTCNSNLTAANYRAAQNGTGQTALPAGITPASNTTSSLQLIWMAIT